MQAGPDVVSVLGNSTASSRLLMTQMTNKLIFLISFGLRKYVLMTMSLSEVLQRYTSFITPKLYQTLMSQLMEKSA